MRISDWSSDVCSSDLKPDLADTERRGDLLDEAAKGGGIERPYLDGDAGPGKARHAHQPRLGRPGVRQHEQPVVGRGARVAHQDRTSTRLNSRPSCASRVPSSACKKQCKHPYNKSRIASRNTNSLT